LETKRKRMDGAKVREYCHDAWDKKILPTLQDYIRIPNLSPGFDADWAKKPHTESAVKLLSEWAQAQELKGASLEVIREEGRTPLIFITVEGTNNTNETIMMYGHLDKQPPCEGWFEDQDIHPYKPTIKDDKLYGRGGADDGYAIFAAMTSLKALQDHGLPHGRIVIIIEACEESGSPDLPFYITKLKARIGTPSLIICLDSGCGNYEQFWLTTSLRGMIGAEVCVKILKEGVHSGHASGIVPSSFRIFRNILNRLEDPKTGKVVAKAFSVDIPKKDKAQAKEAAKSLGNAIFEEFPWIEGAGPIDTKLDELLLNRTWRPQLAVTGANGFPPVETAGNVLRAHSTFMVSLRLPPTLNHQNAAAALKDLIEKDPPYGAKVTCTIHKSASGWAAPEMEDWLSNSVNDASNNFFGKPAAFIGEGGSIPFMGMLGEMFPQAQFVITGVLGPKSNAHGPNEFIHIPMGKNLTACVSSIIHDHYTVKVGDQHKKQKTE